MLLPWLQLLDRLLLPGLPLEVVCRRRVVLGARVVPHRPVPVVSLRRPLE